MLTPEQCRASRQWLDISQSALANMAGISKDAVMDLELGRREPMPKTIEKLQTALESQGIVFTFDEHEMPVGLILHNVREIRNFMDAALSPEQCRAARGWLGWTQQELAIRSSVGLSTIRDFETQYRRRGRKPHVMLPANLDAIIDLFTNFGIHFLFGSGGRPHGIEFIPQQREERLVA